MMTINKLTRRQRLSLWWSFLRARIVGQWRKRIVIPYQRRKSIPKDEFDPSLDMDPLAVIEMNRGERDAYFKDLTSRRKKAHDANLD